MIAKKVFENIEFQRGLDPKKALRVGKFRSPLFQALINPINEVNGDGFYQWMTDNPKLAKALEFDTNPLPLDNYLTFDLDWYCEENNIDREELIKDFDYSSNYIINPAISKPGEVSPRIGKLKSFPNSKIIYYFGGNIDGFITRKDWLG
jgi:hypothetical protein